MSIVLRPEEYQSEKRGCNSIASKSGERERKRGRGGCNSLSGYDEEEQQRDPHSSFVKQMR